MRLDLPYASIVHVWRRSDISEPTDKQVEAFIGAFHAAKTDRYQDDVKCGLAAALKAEPALPEHLRDPATVLKRGQELLDGGFGEPAQPDPKSGLNSGECIPKAEPAQPEPVGFKKAEPPSKFDMDWSFYAEDDFRIPETLEEFKAACYHFHKAAQQSGEGT